MDDFDFKNYHVCVTKTKYFCDYIKNKPELDRLFHEFENVENGFVHVLKVQNLEHDKLFPCFVVYIKSVYESD